MGGDLVLTQSNAILGYIGRKFDLMGDASAMHLVDLVLEQATDFDNDVTGRSYQNVAGLWQYCEEQLPATLHQWQRLLGGKTFMAGERVTVADLKVYETFRKLRIFEEQGSAWSKTERNSFAKFPSLLGFIKRIEALPAMQRYMASAAYMARP